MKHDLMNCRLYGILDLGYVAVDSAKEVCRELLLGGADVIQLRAKGYDKEVIESVAHRIRIVCSEFEVPFIINDYPEIALGVNADGVHVGQDDGSLMRVREIVGDEMLVGRSTHSKEQALVALAEGFDYIGFGPLYPTPTKKGRPGIGIESIDFVEKKVGCEIPVFCIGGIRRDNIRIVAESGAYRVVIVSDLLRAESIRSATQEAKNILLSY